MFFDDIPMKISYPTRDVSVSQTFAQQLGRLSNCNVVVQHKVSFGIDCFRLVCTHCNAEKSMDRLPIKGDENVVLEFATAHRHPAQPAIVNDPEHRKFRERE